MRYMHVMCDNDVFSHTACCDIDVGLVECFVYSGLCVSKTCLGFLCFLHVVVVGVHSCLLHPPSVSL